MGISRPMAAEKKSTDDRAESGGVGNDATTNGLHLEKIATQKESDWTCDTPFTAEELTRALTAVRLEEKE